MRLYSQCKKTYPISDTFEEDTHPFMLAATHELSICRLIVTNGTCRKVQALDNFDCFSMAHLEISGLPRSWRCDRSLQRPSAERIAIVLILYYNCKVSAPKGAVQLNIAILPLGQTDGLRLQSERILPACHRQGMPPDPHLTFASSSQTSPLMHFAIYTCHISRICGSFQYIFLQKDVCFQAHITQLPSSALHLQPYVLACQSL